MLHYTTKVAERKEFYGKKLKKLKNQEDLFYRLQLTEEIGKDGVAVYAEDVANGMTVEILGIMVIVLRDGRGDEP